MMSKKITRTDSTVKQLTFTALLAALTCIATSIIRIPIPATGGYIHPGDAFVILSGIFLGPVYGLFAGGIGSALSDLLGGYIVYIPITFITKALMAVVAYFVFKSTQNLLKKQIFRVIAGGLAATVILVIGYFVFELPLYGNGAFISLFPNFIQGISGVIISSILSPIFIRINKSYLNS